jgi:hypothetical protein
VGIIFFIGGVVAGISRFYFGVKPKILNMKAFAFYSYYIDEKYLEIIKNNYGEEITGFLLITGLFLFAFSREKNEKDEYCFLRMKALAASFYLNFAFLLAALLFTYGFAFIYMLMFNMGFGLLAYITVFQVLLFRHRRENLNNRLTNYPGQTK